MKLELVSFTLCPFVHRAAIMLLEKNVPFTTRYIDLKNKPDWFLKISPRGKVPLLVADGTVIFESSAIMEFLDETNPPRIVPEDPFERARQRAWIEPANDLFEAHYELCAARTREDFDEALATLRRIADRYEETLKEPFFAGPDLGIVDIAAAPAFFRLGIIESRSSFRALPSTPKVDAWARRLASRDTVKRSVAAEFVEAYVSWVKAKDGVLAAQLTSK